MKIVQTGTIVGLAFFLSTGISFGADLDDIDFTIRVVESDDVSEMHNELSLPDMTFDVVHAEVEVDHEADVHENETFLHMSEMEARDEREDEIEGHDEAREDNDDVSDGHDEDHGEDHEAEHEKEDH